MIRRIAAGVLLCFCTAALLPAAADVLPSKVRIEPVLKNLSNHPQAAAFAPDGRIFLLERTTGNVRIVKFGKLLPDPFVHVNVATASEQGLLGIALHPKFQQNGWVYLYYTQNAPVTNRIVRYTAAGDKGVDPFVILDNIGADTGGEDNGGAMTFGADGKLYVGTGVFHVDGDAQNCGCLAGKVLRINDDGSVPADNPHLGTTYPYTLIWAQGFRNVAGVAAHPTAGTVYVTDNYDEDATCDETNVVRSGQNYGWNAVSCSAGAYTGPLQSITPQVLPSSTASYGGSKLPFTNNLFVAGAGNGKILRDELSGAGFDTLSSASDFYVPSGGVCPVAIRDVKAPKDGWLYAVSDDATQANNGLYRFVYDDVGSNAGAREVSGTPYLPLSVAKDGAGLRLWWEDLKRDAYNCSPPTENMYNSANPAQAHCPSGWTASQKYTVWQGDLASPFAYNHAKLAENDGDGTQQNDALRSYALSMPTGNKYYLLSARGANREGALGLASNGTPRPGSSTADRCDTIGWSSTQIPPPVSVPMWNKCNVDWPHTYPDQDGVMHTLSEWRGRALVISFMQFG